MLTEKNESAGILSMSPWYERIVWKAVRAHQWLSWMARPVELPWNC